MKFPTQHPANIATPILTRPGDHWIRDYSQNTPVRILRPSPPRPGFGNTPAIPGWTGEELGET